VTERRLVNLFVAGVSIFAACRRAVPTAAAPDAVVTGASASATSLTPVERLGMSLFEDTNLSEPPGQACASCHDAHHAFTGDGGSRIAGVARGSRPDIFGNRNAQSIMYAAFRPPFRFVSERDEHGDVDIKPTGGLFWDGRADTLAEQAKGPFMNPREMNNAGPVAVVDKVRRSDYAALFRTVYGATALDDAGAAFDRIGEAIAAFEQTPRFRPFSSKFDAFLRGQATLDAREARGFALFKDPDKGNCIACHAGQADSRDPADWLFTDFTFDAVGMPRNRGIPDNATATSFDLGLCRQERAAARAPAGFDVETLCGAFQVPTLRNVELTAPYGHNGVFATLREVVRFYATRDTNPERWYPTDAGRVHKLDDLPAGAHANVNTKEVPYDRRPGQRPRLTEDDVDAIVAFLRTLTDR
jgi:cytochrome c peroxidase